MMKLLLMDLKIIPLINDLKLAVQAFYGRTKGAVKSDQPRPAKIANGGQPRYDG
jgi:hypothetical protein